MSTATLAALPDVPADLAPRVVRPEDAGYSLVRSSYMAVGSPRVVIMAETDDDVAAGITYAAAARAELGSQVPFAVRSGGHGIAGTSTNVGGIVLDLSRMNRVGLDGDRLHAQAGAGWGAVSQVLAPHDLVITSGNFGDTGVGGLGTAGGVGFFARSQGLTIDRVRRAKLATADGHVRWVDAEHEPELFWAVRGGATHVGIVTELDLEPVRLHTTTANAAIIHQEVQYLVSDLAAFTRNWGEWIDGAPRAAESFLMVQATGDGRHVVRGRTVWANDDITAARPTLEAALSLDSVMRQDAAIMTYPSIVPSPGGVHVGQQQIHMRDVLVNEADEAVGTALAEALAHRGTIVGELRALGGAVSDVAADATAWAGRSQKALAGIWLQPADAATEDDAFAALQALGTGTYAAYSSDTRPSASALAWPGTTGERLRTIAESVDPAALFDGGHTLRG